MKKLATATAIVIVILAALGVAFYSWWAWSLYSHMGQGMPQTTPNTQTQVSTLVTSFGQVMKNVPLSGTKDIANQAMDQNYSQYLTAALLVSWKDDPTKAVGRLTSSPWPDHVEINTLAAKSDGSYVVDGVVVEMTSEEIAHGGDAGREPIRFTVVDVDGHWLISDVVWQQGQQAGDQTTRYEQTGEFTLDVPSNYEAQAGYGLPGANLDASLVEFSIPDGAINASGTNYVEAYVVVSKSTSTEAVAGCDSFDNIMDQTNTSSSPEVINGVTFTVQSTVGAGAGNLYESRLYRAVHNNACYEIATVIHTGQRLNYDPPVDEFDRSLALDPLVAIVKSFKFE